MRIVIQSFQKLSPTFKNEREGQLCGANYSNDILILIIWQYLELNKYLKFLVISRFIHFGILQFINELSL